jgi:hypothetical protein
MLSEEKLVQKISWEVIMRVMSKRKFKRSKENEYLWNKWVLLESIFEWRMWLDCRLKILQLKERIFCWVLVAGFSTRLKLLQSKSFLLVSGWMRGWSCFSVGDSLKLLQRSFTLMNLHFENTAVEGGLEWHLELVCLELQLDKISFVSIV